MCDREKIWVQFQGKNSKKLYNIKNASTEHVAEITNSMIKYFLKEEPTCKYLRCYEDDHFIDELKIVWKECVDQKFSLVCLTDEPNPQLAGFLLLCRSTPNDEPLKIYNSNWLKICNIIEYISNESKPYERLNISQYLTDLGLLTLPDFRGDGIAEELLNTCEMVCRDHNLPAIIITFTSIGSQTVAKKVGFQELYSISFEKLRQMDQKKYGIQNIEEHTKDIKYMYKLATKNYN